MGRGEFGLATLAVNQWPAEIIPPLSESIRLPNRLLKPRSGIHLVAGLNSEGYVSIGHPGRSMDSPGLLPLRMKR